MVRLLTLAVASLAAFASTDAASVVNLPKGQYYRPSGSEVSGRVDATTLYLRSPCPALNSMANHGLIPRDGKGLTRPMLKAAAMDVFNIAEDLAEVMVGLMPSTPTFTLATLATHNAIEHDVSLSRRDTYFGGDQSVADPLYLLDIVSYGFLDLQLSINDVAKIRVKRAAECKATNPQCDFGDNQQFIANAESGLMLRGLGGENTETIPLRNVYKFFVEEKFPSDYTKPSTPITFANVSATIESLKTLQVFK
jgi:hypothetical protein